MAVVKVRPVRKIAKRVKCDITMTKMAQTLAESEREGEEREHTSQTDNCDHTAADYKCYKLVAFNRRGIC